MVLKFEDFVNEGFVNKTLKRVRTGAIKSENNIGLTNEENEIYKLFGELCEGGAYNNSEECIKFAKVLKNIDTDKYDDFIFNIFGSLKKMGCESIKFNPSMVNTIKEGSNAIVFFDESNTMTNLSEFAMWGLIDERLTTIRIHHEISIDDNKTHILRIHMNDGVEKNQLDQIGVDSSDDYVAYKIPIEVFKKIISQNKRTGRHKNCGIWKK